MWDEEGSPVAEDVHYRKVVEDRLTVHATVCVVEEWHLLGMMILHSTPRQRERQEWQFAMFPRFGLYLPVLHHSGWTEIAMDISQW